MGASKGLGRGIAAALAREGARVAAVSRSPERIEDASAAVSAETGGEVRPFAGDTDDVEHMPGLVRQVSEHLGAVEILVTNTGGPPFGESLSFDIDQWQAAYRSLVLAPLALVEAVVPVMREAAWGRIVNVTSMATKEPIPGLMLSNSHRLAAVGAFKSLVPELAPHGILVNSVAHGRIATDRMAISVGR